LHFSSAGGHAEAADELLLHGADISPVNKKGQTFLHLAVLSRSTGTVAVLLDKGAVVSARNLEGSTALHLAADQGHREIINLLTDYRAKVGLVDKLGRTPLHRSAYLGYGAATKLLVDRGSVVTTEDNDRRTARDLAEGSDRAIKALNGEEPGLLLASCTAMLVMNLPAWFTSPFRFWRFGLGRNGIPATPSEAEKNSDPREPNYISLRSLISLLHVN
jgi:ankyrin repeat protein